MGYFEGYYFKCDGKTDSVAFIFGKQSEKGGKSSFIQILTKDCSFYQEFKNGAAFSKGRRNFDISIGENRVRHSGLSLNIDNGDLRAKGEVCFGEFSPVKYDVMGFFKFFPFMECRHTVVSMLHPCNGQIEINGQIYNFDGGSCYIEGDRGKSFPQKYFWTQCNMFDGFSAPLSVFASCARIPYLGNIFTGTVCVIQSDGREFRIATYLGAEVKEFSKKRLFLVQGRGKRRLTLEIENLDPFENGRALSAPKNGGMSRTIHEKLYANVRYKFTIGTRVEFNFISNRAAFEYSDEILTT